MKIPLLCLFLFLNGLFIPSARADDNRLDKPFGLYLGLLSDPLLTYAGLNAAYNLDDTFRLTGGVGYSHGGYSSLQPTNGVYSNQLTLTSNYVIGIGIKALVQHAEFSPIIGLNLSNLINFNIDGAGTFADVVILSTNVGFDYQAKDGFDLGVDVSMPIGIVSSEAFSNTFFILPGVNIGKFF
jgi:hypothetical protein